MDRISERRAGGGGSAWRAFKARFATATGLAFGCMSPRRQPDAGRNPRHPPSPRGSTTCWTLAWWSLAIASAGGKRHGTATVPYAWCRSSDHERRTTPAGRFRFGGRESLGRGDEAFGRKGLDEGVGEGHGGGGGGGWEGGGG